MPSNKGLQYLSGAYEGDGAHNSDGDEDSDGGLSYVQLSTPATPFVSKRARIKRGISVSSAASTGQNTMVIAAS